MSNMSLLSVCHDRFETMLLTASPFVSKAKLGNKDVYVLSDDAMWNDLVCIKIDRILFIQKVALRHNSDFEDIDNDVFYISRLKNGAWFDYAVSTNTISCSQVAYLVAFESEHLLPELNAIVSSYARPYQVFDPKEKWIEC